MPQKLHLKPTLTKQQLQDKYKSFDVPTALHGLVCYISGEIERCLSCDDLLTANHIDEGITNSIALLNDLPPYSLLIINAIKDVARYSSNDVYYGYLTLARADARVQLTKRLYATEGNHCGDCA